MAVRRLHCFLGIMLGLFVLSHLAVHLTALAGPDVHMSALAFVRVVYRNRLVEPLLLGGFAIQIALGVRLAASRWAKARTWARVQIVSGAALAAFVVIHSSAALIARRAGLDTNFYWASGTLLHPVLKFGFYPYYLAAVIAVFAHMAAMARIRGAGRPAALAIVGVGVVVAGLIVAVFGGAFHRIEQPPQYRAFYDALIGG